MLQTAPAAADPLRDLLGLRLIAAATAPPVVHETLLPGTGLVPGDGILACDRVAVATPDEIAGRLAMAAARGWTRLDLEHGRSVVVAFGTAGAGPQVAALSWRGDLRPWDEARRWVLPQIDGTWLVTGEDAGSLAIAVGRTAQRSPPEATGWTTIAGKGPVLCEVHRRDLAERAIEHNGAIQLTVSATTTTTTLAVNPRLLSAHTSTYTPSPAESSAHAQH